ncbi:MAG: hypothetical protein LAO18_08110 [Acidobacteriia bacterium]|nr:hypothetical protein [Terriglobia bacterium]
MEKKEDVWEFEKLEQQLHSFLDEMSELSRKKPNDPVNKFKLKFVNTTLDKLNRLLADYRPFEDFQQFDVDTLPSNSDVVLILAQYIAAGHRFRTDNTAEDDEDNWCWIVRGKTSDLIAGDPDAFKYSSEKNK